MQNILYEEGSIWVFVLVTVLLGGGAAWRVGRTVARAWRSMLVLPFYILMLGAAVRFIHYALFNGTLLSGWFFFVDYVVLLAVAMLGFRVTRAGQMSRQYRWAFDRAGPLGWKMRHSPSFPRKGRRRFHHVPNRSDTVRRQVLP